MRDAERRLHQRHIVACVWDFDKTLIPGYMQQPLFDRYGLDGRAFWDEVNRLPAIYAQRGVRVSGESVYLNHLLSFVRRGPLKGLSNADLRDLGRELRFFPGLPDFFNELRALVQGRAAYTKHDLRLEHYIISTGLAEMIRGSAIAPLVDGIFASEFIEDPLPPFYPQQPEMPIDVGGGIAQIGSIVDNTTKTRFIFEINKGTNRDPQIDVNAKMAPEDRRVPLSSMIYIADGPSDVPVFSVVRKGGGRCFAVYDPDSQAEFEQNDQLLQDGRVNAYGPADYRSQSQTARWLKLAVTRICDRLVEDAELALSRRIRHPPRHLHREDELPAKRPVEPQGDLFPGEPES